jgi:acetylornithine deacetylase
VAADPAAEDRVSRAIQQLEPDYQSLLQQLVRIPSPVGQEGDAQALVSRHMREIGLAVDSFDLDPAVLSHHPGFNSSPRTYVGRPCVVGRRTGSGHGRSLLLNAHIDTVPVEAPESWMHPPYAGVIDGTRLYGRGSCDDKAGIIESLLVVHAIAEAGIALAGDLTIASVIEDESTGNGSLACVERGYTADGVIIVDGTWPERFIVSHMGHVSFRIDLAGVAGHATSAGPNPIGAVGLVVEGLREFAERQNALHAIPWGTKRDPIFVTVGTIHGGVWPGSVPARCVLEGQYGFPPPGSCEAARQELRATLDEVSRRPDWPLTEPAGIDFMGLETEPELGDPTNPIVDLLRGTVRRRQHAELQESVIVGHCDLRHYTKARSGGTSAACLYGPGGGRNVHGADEYFELAHLPVVAATLASVALRWCGIAGER